NSQNDGQTYNNINIQHVTAKNIFRKGIALYNLTGTSTGDMIENDTFDNVGSIINDGGNAYEGTAAIAVFGSNALIEDNMISHSAGGILANTFDGSSLLLTVSGNQITSPATVLSNGALGLDLASLAGGSTISGNTIDLTGSGTAGNDIGIVISFVHGSVTVGGSASDANTITGKGDDIGILLYQDTLSGSPVLVAGNIVHGTSDGTGILLTGSPSDTSRFGDSGGAVYATLTGNTVSGYVTGVAVASSGSTVSATIGDGTISGANAITTNGDGIDISGNAQATIIGNAITANANGIGVYNTAVAFIGDGTVGGANQIDGGLDGITVQDSAQATIDENAIFNDLSIGGVGVQVLSGASASIGNNTFDVGGQYGADLEIDGTVMGGAISGNSFNATDVYIDNESANYLDATNGNSFGGVDPAAGATTLAQEYGIEDKIIDGIDQSGFGLVRIVANKVYVAHSSEVGTPGSAGAIQRAVNLANTGPITNTVGDDTVYVQAGTYNDNISIPKKISLVGAGEGSTIVVPAFSGVLPAAAGSLPAGSSNVILIQHSDVEISGLTIDGNNTALTSGTVVAGVDIDARNGIIEDFNAGVFDNTYIHDVTVENIYLRGIYASSGGTGFKIDDNTVDNVQGSNESIAIFNFGGAGEIAGNHVSNAADAISTNHSLGTNIFGNVITSSGSGIHSDNNGDGAGAVADSIHNNMISMGSAGAYGIFVFVPYLDVSVANNTISGVDVGLAAFGGQGGSANFSGNTVSVNAGGAGAYVTTDTLSFGQMNVDAT
ncbi:MAG TPA: right-handed parallel beta-helix repeat-containing protein, partial [Pirellulales bacterium]